MTPLSLEFETLAIGEPQHFRNLTLFPLLRPKERALSPYILADEAIHQGLARVTEIAGGTVPELQFENRCDAPALLLDGEELVGAKQNRVVNLTILVPAQSVTVIPVSCVEAGRWHMESAEFAPAPHLMYPAARASRVQQVTASMRVSGNRRSDQGAVWENIAAKAERMDAASPTSAMHAVFERHAHSVEEYVRGFQAVPGQTGAIFATGEVFGLDLFDRSETFAAVFGKLIRSYSLDAIEHDGCAAAPIDRAREFMARLGSANAVTQPAVGLGKDVRFGGSSITGAALWAEDRYVHVCGFSNGEPKGGAFHSRMTRPSLRRSRSSER